MRRSNGLLGFAVCLAAAFLCLKATAQAHRVNVFCWVDGGEVTCESTFAGGSPVKDGRIEVQARGSGQLLLAGQTDSQGRFRFTPPSKAKEQALDLKVVCIASLGHKSFWVVRSEEYTTARKDGSGPEAQARGHAPSASQDRAEAEKPTESGPQSELKERRLQQALSAALQEELAPIKKSLAEIRQNRISIQDVLGGLGYILGLTGIGLFFASRRG